MACACRLPLDPSCHAGAMSAAGHVPLPSELAPTLTSKRNVVVPCAPRRCTGEVGRVGRNVGLRRETAAVATVLAAAVAGAQELDRVGNDIDRLPLVALLVLPLAPVETPVDRDRPALRQVLGAVLTLSAPDRDVEVVRLLDPVARGVLAPRVGRDPQAADGRTALRRAQLGIAREVAREDDPVDVRAGHDGGPPLLEDSSGESTADAGLKSATGRRRCGKVGEFYRAVAFVTLARVGCGASGHPLGAARLPRARLRRPRRRRRGRSRAQLDDPEAQHAVRDLQHVVEPLQQRNVGLELEQVVVRLGPVIDLERHPAHAPVVTPDQRLGADRLLDVAEDLLPAPLGGVRVEQQHEVVLAGHPAAEDSSGTGAGRETSAAQPTSDGSSAAPGGPSYEIDPSYSAMHRCARATTSARWVETTAAAPPLTASSISAVRVSRLPGSRPSNGSSASRSEKSRTKASAIELFCLIPRLNLEGRSPAREVSPSWSSSEAPRDCQSSTPCKRPTYSMCSSRLRSS